MAEQRITVIGLVADDNPVRGALPHFTWRWRRLLEARSRRAGQPYSAG